jgi:hypothetical protein
MKLVATQTGYYGGRIINPGEDFEFDDDEWHAADGKRRPSWAQKVGSDDHKDAQVRVPKNWRKLSGKARIGLAKSISGTEFVSESDADLVIAAHLGEDDDGKDKAPKGKASKEAKKSEADNINEQTGADRDDWVDPHKSGSSAESVAQDVANRAGRAGKRSA